MGSVVVQVTTCKEADQLVETLRAADFGVTSMDARGATGPVQVVFTVIKRRDLDQVLSIIQAFDPRAFYAVNDLQTAEAGISPTTRAGSRSLIGLPLRLFRPAA
jgi:uncharacterized protein YebE (UPF0316 family)